MEDKTENNKMPYDINLLIAANGKKMQHFYTLPPNERQKLLDSIIKTNEKIEQRKC